MGSASLTRRPYRAQALAAEALELLLRQLLFTEGVSFPTTSLHRVSVVLALETFCRRALGQLTAKGTFSGWVPCLGRGLGCVSYCLWASISSLLGLVRALCFGATWTAGARAVGLRH